jgi:hypothetical protein
MQVLILKVVRGCSKIVQNLRDLGLRSGDGLAGRTDPKKQKRQQRCWRQAVKAMIPNKDSNLDSFFCPEKNGQNIAWPGNISVRNPLPLRRWVTRCARSEDMEQRKKAGEAKRIACSG